ncbi:MAG: hypothetical protein IJO11_00170, partial [Alphaproteobacteria bacterium]|nr:hypothetical protein [Alphaproteobacteria bacterium]
RCMEPREWVNNDCICNGPKSVWNNETQLCECPKNYYTEDCSVYCAGANSKWDSTNNKCTCTLANSTWNTTQNKCICNTNYYGPSCTYCAGNYTKWDSTNNKCTCTQTTREWNGTACVCKTGYYGDNCTYCAGDYTKWDTTTNSCTCTLENSSWDAINKKCVCINGTTWSESEKSCVTPGSTEDTCYAPRLWINGICTCPTTTPYYKSSTNECLKCYQVNESKPYWNGTKCIACYEKDASTPVWSTTENQCVPCETLDKTKPYWNGSICTICPSDKPYWDTNKKECVACATFNVDTPVWDSTNKKCISCYASNNAKPYWNGTKCIACYEKNISTPVWSTSKNQCVACETLDKTKPFWDTTKKECVAICPTDKPTYNSNKVCVTCSSLNSAKPYWNGTKCVACLDNTHCKDNYYCNTSSTYACEELNCDKMGFETRAFYCSYVDFGSYAGYTPWMKIDKGYSTGDGDWTEVSGCRNSILVVPKDFQGELTLSNCRVGTITIDGVEYKLNGTTYTLNLKKGIHSITFRTNRNKGAESCRIKFHLTPGWDICMHYIENCPEGYYCEPDKLNPISCPSGYYCPVESYLGPTSCDDDTYTNEVSKTECERCSNRFWRSSNNYCYRCDHTSTIETTKDACEHCANRYWVDGKCYPCPSGMTRDTNTGICKCNTNYIYDRDSKTCVACSTTDHFASTELSTEKSCPAKRFYADNADSYVCTDATNHPVTTQANCLFCGSKNVRYWRSNDSDCFSCNFVGDGYTSNTTDTECHTCSNRYWRSDNYCFYCSHSSTREKILQTECERCPTRHWVGTIAATATTPTLGNCYLCPTGMTRDTNTGICKCNTNYIYNRDSKTCVSCTETTSGVLSTEKATEASCPQTRYYANDAKAYSCSVTTQNPETTKNNCLFCGTNVRFWKSKNNYCYHCLDTDEVADTTKAECEVCTNRYWVDGKCYPCPSGMTRDTNTGICKCNTNYIYDRDSKTCVACSTTDHFASTELSTEKSCPAKRFYADNADSYVCTDATNHPVTTQANCLFCGSKNVRYWRSNDGDCFSCNFVGDGYTSNTTQAECHTCANRYWKSNNNCFYCEHTDYRESVEKEECNRCTNRFWKSNKTCFHCGRSDATSDITQLECNRCTHRFWKSNGYCYNCDRTDSASDITQVECNRCTNRFWKSNGNCYNCSASSVKEVTKAECIRCSNRYWTVTDTTNGLGTCTKCTSGKTPNADKTACE